MIKIDNIIITLLSSTFIIIALVAKLKYKKKFYYSALIYILLNTIYINLVFFDVLKMYSNLALIPVLVYTISLIIELKLTNRLNFKSTISNIIYNFKFKKKKFFIILLYALGIYLLLNFVMFLGFVIIVNGYSYLELLPVLITIGIAVLTAISLITKLQIYV
jgi:hypothetical protein